MGSATSAKIGKILQDNWDHTSKVGASSGAPRRLWLSTFLLSFTNIIFATMKWLLFLGFLVLGILALRGVRWAYITYIVLGLLYLPVSVGFRLNPQPCEVALSIPLAIHSLTNYAHIVLLLWFFLMTSAQLRMSHWSGFAWAALISVSMGILVELAQGITGRGHCRLRDLIPDTAGIVLGAGIAYLWNRVRRRRRVT